MQSRSSFYNKQVLTVEMLYKDANRMANIAGPEQTVRSILIQQFDPGFHCLLLDLPVQKL